MRKVLAGLLVLAGALLSDACSSSPPPPIDGCPRGVSQEAYQTGMYECPDGTLVFTFPTTDARDGWISTATKFAGTNVVGKGDTWVKVREAG